MDLQIKRIKGTARLHSTPFVYKKRTNRPGWAVAIKREGSTEYYKNGKSVLSDPTHICLLPMGASYEWKTSGGECLIIEFEADLRGDEPVTIPVKDPSEIVNLFYRIERDRLQNGNTYASISDLYRILSVLLDSHDKNYALTRKEKIILPAVRSMRENYSDPDFSVKALSDVAGISDIYFRRIFTEIYGVSPSEYLYQLRMKKAAELLQTDYGSVEEVACSVGYHSLFHFSKMFKKYYGVSPSNYSLKG